ncbi:MAG: LysM peptidoglycan-binding domain-containing protein, partial [Rhodoferax sp.]|nr:LysM peptidoglycan-binding domain-containing protein [Rhodoferax sp.]
SPADAAKRVGMAEDELRSVNNIPPRMRVKAGSTLLVRRSASMNDDVTAHVANNGYLTLAPDVVLRKTVVKAGKKDNVASMARRFSVSPQVLADWNKVSTAAAFKRGQSVVLYLPAKARSGRGAKARGKTAVAKAAKRGPAKRAPVKSAARKKPVKLARQ